MRGFVCMYALLGVLTEGPLLAFLRSPFALHHAIGHIIISSAVMVPANAPYTHAYDINTVSIASYHSICLYQMASLIVVIATWTFLRSSLDVSRTWTNICHLCWGVISERSCSCPGQPPPPLPNSNVNINGSFSNWSSLLPEDAAVQHLVEYTCDRCGNMCECLSEEELLLRCKFLVQTMSMQAYRPDHVFIVAHHCIRGQDITITPAQFNHLCRLRLGVNPMDDYAGLLKHAGKLLLTASTASIGILVAVICIGPLITHSAAMQSLCAAGGIVDRYPTISCGGHTPATGMCSGCPDIALRGNDADWCNGDCYWQPEFGLCMGKSTSIDDVHAFIVQWILSVLGSVWYQVLPVVQLALQNYVYPLMESCSHMHAHEVIEALLVAGLVCGGMLMANATFAPPVHWWCMVYLILLHDQNMDAILQTLFSILFGPGSLAHGCAAAACTWAGAYAQDLQAFTKRTGATDAARATIRLCVSSGQALGIHSTLALVLLWIVIAYTAAATVVYMRRWVTRCNAVESAKRASAEKERDTLAGRLDTLVHTSQCVVCLEAPRTTALFPCKHMHMCANCAVQCNSCPICRSTVLRRETLFV